MIPVHPMFLEVYSAPSRTDSEGRVWYKCLSDSDFANGQVGWAVGAGQILRTQDAGKTWKNQYAPHMSDTLFEPHRVSTPTQHSCWVIDTVGHGEISCLHTKDGGVTWEGVKFHDFQRTKDIFFVSPRLGWLLTVDSPAKGRGGSLYATDDGGKTWLAKKLVTEGEPEIVRFINSHQGWLVERVVTKDQARSSGQLYSSANGGQTWLRLATFDKRILDLVVVDQNRILVVGEDGFIARTRDGGKSWRRLKTDTQAAMNSIAANDGQAIVGGDFGTILISHDCGSTWSKMNIFPKGSNCVSILVLSSDRALVVADKAIYLLAPFPEYVFKTSSIM